MFQLGFDTDAFGLVFASDYKAKVLAGEEGRSTQATVEKFLEKLPSPCTELSFSKEKMLKEFLFTDSEITYERVTSKMNKMNLFFFFKLHTQMALISVFSCVWSLTFTACENTFSKISTYFIFSPCRQLVKSGVLTVRDAGSWWLSIPNSGKFTKYFIQGGCYEKEQIPKYYSFNDVACKYLFLPDFDSALLIGRLFV